MPTFLIVGAARSGTTALYYYLKQHPEVFMSKLKEPNFFAFANEVPACSGPGSEYINNSITKLADYHSLFEDAAGESAVGEVSPLYLYSERAPARIHHYLPKARILAILRNPVEQAFSHFLYAKRQMLEPLEDFATALASEGKRKEKGWQPLFQYSQFPKYHQQLQRYFEKFPAEQIKIFLYEDLQEKPHTVLRDIFAFIGVDEDFDPDISYRPNAGGIPRNRLLQNLVMKPFPIGKVVGRLLPEGFKRSIRDAVSDLNLQNPPIPHTAKALLIAELRNDIMRLQDLLDRDLSAWLQ